jgi:hypothetical protein
LLARTVVGVSGKCPLCFGFVCTRLRCYQCNKSEYEFQNLRAAETFDVTLLMYTLHNIKELLLNPKLLFLWA